MYCIFSKNVSYIIQNCLSRRTREKLIYISEETAKTFASASSDDQKKATEIAYICLYSHNQSDSDINHVTYVSAHAFVGSASSS